MLVRGAGYKNRQRLNYQLTPTRTRLLLNFSLVVSTDMHTVSGSLQSLTFWVMYMMNQIPLAFHKTCFALQTQLLIESLLSLDTSKSSGIDSISAKMLRFAAYSIQLLVSPNSLITTGAFPREWKLARIVLVPKSDCPSTLVSGYRSISILSIVNYISTLLCVGRGVASPLCAPVIIDAIIQVSFQLKHVISHTKLTFSSIIDTGYIQK